MKVSRKDVKAIVEATFPDYKGCKISVSVDRAVRFYDLNWSGGTRNEYRACTVDGHWAGDLAEANQAAPWDNQIEGQQAYIPLNVVIVRHSIFCGKDCGLTIYVNLENLAKMLPGLVK